MLVQTEKKSVPPDIFELSIKPSPSFEYYFVDNTVAFPGSSVYQQAGDVGKESVHMRHMRMFVFRLISTVTVRKSVQDRDYIILDQTTEELDDSNHNFLMESERRMHGC